MKQSLNQFIATVLHHQNAQKKEDEDVIKVSETVAKAATVYEVIRNTLEYDEEHLLRRNAIRRMLKRRFGDENLEELAHDLVHELIWAKYLPNKKVPTSLIEEVKEILEKYQSLFDGLDSHEKDYQKLNLWLIDLLSTELEYYIVPPHIEESLASFAYQDLKDRIEWQTKSVKEDDQDLQLFVAVHRAILKSNPATLRYRVFTLYYPDWRKNPTPELIAEIAGNVPLIAQTIEDQVLHPSADALFRFVQKQTVVYHVLRDIVDFDPSAFPELILDDAALQNEVKKVAGVRYSRFYVKLRRTIFRAVVFLFFTKMAIGLAVELPYDVFVMGATDFKPLLTNILFHPFLLAIIGISVRIPVRRNNQQIMKQLRVVIGQEEAAPLKFKTARPWQRGIARILFQVLYAVAFLFSVVLISTILRSFHFNAVSIAFFLFFLSLVMFFGLKIRGTKRELVVVEGSGGIFGALFDVLFLPIIRVGRWLSIRAPKINIFLFFLDFIIEAPFKAAIRIIEGWLAFLKEKKEEI